MNKKANKVKIHRFWILGTNSIDISRDRLFVAKADYDRAIKKIKQLETQLKHSVILCDE